MDNLDDILREGYVAIGKELKTYSVALVTGDVQVQKAADMGAHAVLTGMFHKLQKEVLDYSSSDAAGANSKERVSETVHAVLRTPNGKEVVGE